MARDNVSIADKSEENVKASYYEASRDRKVNLRNSDSQVKVKVAISRYPN